MSAPPGNGPYRVTLHFGRPYRFAGFPGPPGKDGAPTWAEPPGRYEPLEIGKNVHTKQDMVSYRSLGGRNVGEVYFCTLADWAKNFTLEPLPAPPPEPARPAAPETVGRPEGSGY